MNRTPTALSVLAGMLALGALVVSQSARNRVAELAEARRTQDPAIEPLEAQVAALSAEVAALRKEQRDAGERIATLERNLVTAEQSLAAGAAAIEELRRLPSAAVPPAGDSGDDLATQAAQQQATKSEFESLRQKVFSGKATREEQQRFWELARTTGVLTEVIAELAAKVEQVPTDTQARMQLAQAYLARLLSVPDGPERGTWAMKAEEQWQETLELDSHHWEARFSLAVSWSYWPEQFNKTPDAIREFESLRSQQASMPYDEQHSQTYLQLAMLYRRMGNQEKARQTLEEGCSRHPGDEALKKALETSGQ